MYTDTNLSEQTIWTHLISDFDILLIVIEFFVDGVLLRKHFAINHFDRDGFTYINVFGRKMDASQSMQVPGWTCQKNKQSCPKLVENRYLCVLVGKSYLNLLKFKWGGKSPKLILIWIHFQKRLWIFGVYFGSGVLIVFGIFCGMDIQSGFGEVWWVPEIKYPRSFTFVPLESRWWLIWNDICKC